MVRPHQTNALCGLFLSFTSTTLAGFDSSASNNIAVYWGQNSINRALGGQQRLSTYCANTPINIIPMAFLSAIKAPGVTINFSNAGDNCTAFPGSALISCPQMEEDIQTCQSTHNKSLLLSIGGSTYSENGFSSPAEAISAAGTIWSTFGPLNSSSSSSSSIQRPFGSAVIDGFDVDMESAGATNMVDFLRELRRLMGTDKTKRYYLSGAPQCVFPDAAMGEVLNAVPFDFVSVQFYNNWCGVQNWKDGEGATQDAFNFDVWDRWAREGSGNKEVKVLLGVPGSESAAGKGYVSGDGLKGVIEYSRRFESFGGVMMWDMSQVYGNAGFLDSISAALGVADQPSSQQSITTVTTIVTVSSASTVFPTATTPSITTPTRTVSSTAAPTGDLVPQWGQCGGLGYPGPTNCVLPYRCVELSKWWSQCAS